MKFDFLILKKRTKGGYPAENIKTNNYQNKNKRDTESQRVKS